MHKTGRKRICFVLSAGLTVMLSFAAVRCYRGNIKMESCQFTESARELPNTDRGFYKIYRFMITDEETDYGELVRELYDGDEKEGLSLIEINLQNYRDKEISGKGMENIRALFQALDNIDKRLIIRFLYDWDGENEVYEPETIDIILKHMEQMEEILSRAGDQIFVIQGLFTGNWGEMNGTSYSEKEDLCRLAEKLSGITEPSVYLAVRTPAQWRSITGIEKISEDVLAAHPFAGRLSLFNDGMLGNESDYGTYEILKSSGEEFSTRKEELDFQDRLCRRVPNGGEVIHDNQYNDLENAIRDLGAMHVTYLNEGHDLEVLEKWRETTVMEEGCFYGMDGYTYIERHLGYRLLIRKADLDHNVSGRCIEAGVTLKNAGFAPVYVKPVMGLVLYDREQGICRSYEMKGDLRSLSGGGESERELTVTVNIPVDKLPRGKYEVYFFITRPDSGERILLANQQDAEEYGYHIGTIEKNGWF